MIKLVLVLHNLQLQIPMVQSNKTVALDPTENERIHKEVEEVKEVEEEEEEDQEEVVEEEVNMQVLLVLLAA